jgi:class 3 adenylate cyclase
METFAAARLQLKEEGTTGAALGMSDVRRWLEAIGLGQYAGAFKGNDIDMKLLRQIDDQALRDLGMSSAGHRLRVRNAVTKLSPTIKGDLNADTASATSEQPVVSAERRQLTVMFCDLVGSTALSAELDPEDMREVILAYQAACSGVTPTYDASVAKFMGDGMLAYFGYPRAHEDDPERAVRAGLDIVAAVGRIKTRSGHKLQVRIGIATGLVVVGDLIGQGASQEQAVVGDTPNLAASQAALMRCTRPA